MVKTCVACGDAGPPRRTPSRRSAASSASARCRARRHARRAADARPHGSCCAWSAHASAATRRRRSARLRALAAVAAGGAPPLGRRVAGGARPSSSACCSRCCSSSRRARRRRRPRRRARTRRSGRPSAARPRCSRRRPAARRRWATSPTTRRRGSGRRRRRNRSSPRRTRRRSGEARRQGRAARRRRRAAAAVERRRRPRRRARVAASAAESLQHGGTSLARHGVGLRRADLGLGGDYVGAVGVENAVLIGAAASCAARCTRGRGWRWSSARKSLDRSESRETSSAAGSRANGCGTTKVSTSNGIGKSLKEALAAGTHRHGGAPATCALRSTASRLADEERRRASPLRTRRCHSAVAPEPSARRAVASSDVGRARIRADRPSPHEVRRGAAGEDAVSVMASPPPSVTLTRRSADNSALTPHTT